MPLTDTHLIPTMSNHEPPFDPYLIRQPNPAAAAMPKRVWWLAQVMLYSSTSLVGIASVFIGMTMLFQLTGFVPDLGNWGVTLMPYGVAGVLSALVLRRYAHNACSSSIEGKPGAVIRSTIVTGVAWTALTAVVSWFLGSVLVIVIALLAGI